ncbi:MAG: hypothetical protein ACTHW1_06845 [Ancrocorticia sp.]|uniref:hypothetical protein n=1 Tax=Ancrocorticia sp. TaxID=2593684 RepID=UPI003F907945
MTITIELTPERERRLAVLAEKQGRSVDDVARDLLDDGIDEADLADYYRQWKDRGRPSRPAAQLWDELEL